MQIAGRYIKGGKLRDKEATWRQKAVGLGYQQVCGFADVWGDGVVPEPSAHLPGISVANAYVLQIQGLAIRLQIRQKYVPNFTCFQIGELIRATFACVRLEDMQ